MVTALTRRPRWKQARGYLSGQSIICGSVWVLVHGALSAPSRTFVPEEVVAAYEKVREGDGADGKSLSQALQKARAKPRSTSWLPS
jgi:hypothetical protein